MSKLTSLRIPDELYQQIENRAKREHRTLSNLIVSLLFDAMEERGNDVS